MSSKTVRVCDLCSGASDVETAMGVDVCATCCSEGSAGALFDLLKKREAEKAKAPTQWELMQMQAGQRSK